MQSFFSRRRLLITVLILSGLAVIGKLATVLRSRYGRVPSSVDMQTQLPQKAIQDLLTTKARIASLHAQLTVFENILQQYPDNSEARKRADDLRKQLKELE